MSGPRHIASAGETWCARPASPEDFVGIGQASCAIVNGDTVCPECVAEVNRVFGVKIDAPLPSLPEGG